MNFDSMIATATAALTVFGMKIIGAVIAWIIGRALIRLAVRMVSHALMRKHIDATLQQYLGNILNVGLTIVLSVALLGYVGVETTSFAALIAAIGIAIG